jgi:hypothetical protein
VAEDDRRAVQGPRPLRAGTPARPFVAGMNLVLQGVATARAWVPCLRVGHRLHLPAGGRRAFGPSPRVTSRSPLPSPRASCCCHAAAAAPASGKTHSDGWAAEGRNRPESRGPARAAVLAVAVMGSPLDLASGPLVPCRAPARPRHAEPWHAQQTAQVASEGGQDEGGVAFGFRSGSLDPRLRRTHKSRHHVRRISSNGGLRLVWARVSHDPTPGLLALHEVGKLPRRGVQSSVQLPQFVQG